VGLNDFAQFELAYNRRIDCATHCFGESTPTISVKMNSNPSMAMLSSWTDSMTNKKEGGRNPPSHNGRHDPDAKGPSRSHYEEDDQPVNREMRANSSLERFENWTDSQQKSKKSTPSKK